jgi:hypothetical protein
MLVKVSIVGKSSVTAILAYTILDSVMKILAATALCFAKVMRHGIDTKKSNETVELSNPVNGKRLVDIRYYVFQHNVSWPTYARTYLPILEWRTTQTPTMDTGERKGRRGSLTAAAFDHVRFVQNDPPDIFVNVRSR